MTIAQQLNIKIKDIPFEILDKQGNEIYSENSDGYWDKSEYDPEGNQIYYENSDGYWWRIEYDPEGNEIYYEDSEGLVEDNRNLYFLISMTKKNLL